MTCVFPRAGWLSDKHTLRQISEMTAISGEHSSWCWLVWMHNRRNTWLSWFDSYPLPTHECKKKKIKRLQHSWKGGVLLMIRNHCCASSMVEFILLLIVCVIYMSKRYQPSILKDTMLTNCYTQDVYYIKHNFPSSPWRSIGPSWWFPKHITKTIPMSLWRFSVPIYSIDGPYNKMICQTNRLLTRT